MNINEYDSVSGDTTEITDQIDGIEQDSADYATIYLLDRDDGKQRYLVLSREEVFKIADFAANWDNTAE